MDLRGRLSAMNPRERKLLALLGLLAAAFVVLGLPAYLWTELSALRDHNDQIEKLLGRMHRGAELLAKRKQQRQARELRYARPAPALASFIESSARQFGLEVPESTDRPEVPHKGFTERVTVVKMRKVHLEPLVRMLEKIERSGYPVAVTKLKIKTRARGPDLYDVQLGVSAYDKQRAEGAQPGEGKDQGAAGAKGRGTASSGGKRSPASKGREL